MTCHDADDTRNFAQHWRATQEMILTCPSCRTRYRADSAHFRAPGRDVRCAKCGEVWFQRSPEPETRLEPEPVMEAAADSSTASDFGMKPEPEYSRSNVQSWGVSLAKFVAWAILIVLIAGIGWAVVQYRQTIAGLWPQSASLYAALGLPVNAGGISITGVAYRQDMENGLTVLSVTGKLLNVTNRELPVPQIRVVLFDDAKRELYRWTFDPGVVSLKPGAESSFVTRLSSPPPAARDLNVLFAETGETR